MLFLYSQYTLLWLLLGSNNGEKILLERLSDEVPFGVAACIGRCLQQNDTDYNQDGFVANKTLQHTDAENYLHLKPEKLLDMDTDKKKQSEPPNRRYMVLKNCSDICRKEESAAPVAKMKKIQENYLLNLVCRDDKRLSFRVSMTGLANTSLEKTIFVIQLYIAKENFSIYLSDEDFFTFNDLKHNTTYEISATAVHTNNEFSVIAKRQPYTTLRRGYTPSMVKDVQVNSYRVDKFSNKLLWANIQWKPSADMNCDYDVIFFSPERDEYDAIPMEIRDPRQLYTFSVPNLTFSSEYKMGIRAKNRYSLKESDLYWHTFRAPPCEEWYHYDYSICAPQKPKGLSIEQTFLTADSLSLNITWAEPEHYPDYYLVSIVDLDPDGEMYKYNLTGNSTMLFIPSITIQGILFEVHLSAQTLGGSAGTSMPIATRKQMVMFLPDKSNALRLIFIILAPIICLAIITLTSYVLFKHRRAKLKRYQERCKYFEGLEKKAPSDPKTFEYPAKGLATILENDALIQFQKELEEKFLQNDEMEIDRNNLTLHEVLGEGAFGLVRRGIYTSKQFGSKEVAVKMLKDQPTVDEIRAFRHEIEVMKSVEKHPNIVSLIGHCTRHHGEMMLLTEYCSVGNLQTFLRDEWAFLNDLKKRNNSGRSPSNSSSIFKMNYFKTTTPPLPVVVSSSSSSSSGAAGKCEEANVNDNDLNSKRQSFDDSTDKTNDINISGTITTYMLTSSDSQIEDINSSISMGNDSFAMTSGMTSAAENKSYGYDEICTNACKCQVDVIISDMDQHQENGQFNKDIYHLEKILNGKNLKKLRMGSTDDDGDENEQENDDENENEKGEMKLGNIGSWEKMKSKKTIQVRNCECQRQQKQHQHQHRETRTKTKVLENNNNKEFIGNVVENKAYFNQSNDEKDQHIGQLHQHQHQQNQLNQLISKDISKANKQQKKSKDQHHQHHQPNGQCPQSQQENLKSHKQLQSHLQSQSQSKSGPQTPSAGQNDNSLSALAERQPLSAADLLDIAKQVAMGMEYLGRNKVVHRDLAARNVLITNDRTVKIADFGLSRDIYQENIYKKTGNGKLPIKWLALESMTHQVYTTQSDVWSYGILLYEIVSLGGLPYPSIPANRLLHLLKSGYRMDRPENCGEELYKLMSSCWDATPSDRPTFSEIIEALGVLSEKSEEQINYDNLLGVRKIPLPKKISIEVKTDSNDDYLQPV